MKPKVQIHEWKCQIYPIRIWIAVTDDINDLDNKFCDLRTREDLTKIESKHIAFMQMVVRKDINKVGVLIIFAAKRYMTRGTMAHEATHAAREIWERIGETETGYEADAYLVEWIVNLMEQVRINKFEE